MPHFEKALFNSFSNNKGTSKYILKLKGPKNNLHKTRGAHL